MVGVIVFRYSVDTNNDACLLWQSYTLKKVLCDATEETFWLNPLHPKNISVAPKVNGAVGNQNGYFMAFIMDY